MKFKIFVVYLQRTVLSTSLIFLFGISLMICSPRSLANPNSQASLSTPEAQSILQDRFNQASAAEIREITAVAQGLSGDVYFVHIFKGLIPLPARYTLLAQTKDPLEFNSMTRVPAMQRDLIGSILMGECGKWSEEIQTDNHIDLINEQTLYGLTVKTYHPQKKMLTTISDVFITDGHDCLSVLDTDTELWRAMLSFYNDHRDQSYSN